ncbi:ATP-binding cassette sub- A member 2 [Saguinus oedipus]|uniref:ATP-binding cassette sub- A member 2 n=1 Tax=Saguinus oedipus TaxID=9490 RepID=A0ABQ9WKE6_SAGOE|nr:ATP-binding cassette sub- A member 2 [Saguinus oedipus]
MLPQPGSPCGQWGVRRRERASHGTCPLSPSAGHAEELPTSPGAAAGAKPPPRNRLTPNSRCWGLTCPDTGRKTSHVPGLSAHSERSRGLGFPPGMRDPAPCRLGFTCSFKRLAGDPQASARGAPGTSRQRGGRSWAPGEERGGEGSRPPGLNGLSDRMRAARAVAWAARRLPGGGARGYRALAAGASWRARAERGAFKRGRAGRVQTSADRVPDARAPRPRAGDAQRRCGRRGAGRGAEAAERGPAMGFLHQLQLLLWKNVTLKRRSPPEAARSPRAHPGGRGGRHRPGPPPRRALPAPPGAAASGRWLGRAQPRPRVRCYRGSRLSHGTRALRSALSGAAAPLWHPPPASQDSPPPSSSCKAKKPTISVKEAFYTAAPLTSAGILPVMQSLCPDGQRDEFGFLQYANSTVTQLLERLDRVVEEGNLFDPARPGLGSELEALRQHLEALSAGLGTPESYPDRATVSSFSLDSVARDPQELWRFLTQNLSLPNSTAQALLFARVDPPEVYHLLFGPSPALDSESGLPKGQEPWSHLGSNPLFQMEELLLAPALLERLTCAPGSGELGRILTVPESQKGALQGYQDAVCSGEATARARRFSGLATELRNQLDMAKVSQQLGLDAPNGLDSPPQAPPTRRLQALLGDLLDAQKVLQDVDVLSALALLLPQGACTGRTPGPPASGMGGAANGTGVGAASGPNATTEEDTPSAAAPATPDILQGQCSAFVQLWAGLQPILCGNNRTIEPEALRRGNMSSLGFTSKEQRNLGLLVHLMTSNPKILYAPAGSEVDRVILKANETFAFVGNVTHYAQVWLNISAEIRSFLEQGRLQQHLHWLQQYVAELRLHPEALNLSLDELPPALRQDSFSLPSGTALLQQLDTIDNAACGWIQFMSKVSVDIFKGFPDEESIVNYTLNQAYQDNVTVFASVIFQTRKDGSLPPHVHYKIRQNSSFTEKTNEIRRAYWRPGPNTGGRFYFLYGFVWIQDMMERAIIDTFVGHDVVEPGSYVQMFPYPCYTRDDFLFVIEHMMPLCMVISWVYSVAMTIQHIVAEKEHRLKEVMKTMGLNNAVHWVAWFITGFVQLSISVTALTAILKYGQVLMHSHVVIIWLFLAVYAVATIMFCFLVSVLYSKAKLASACGGIIYFLSYVPYMYVAIREEVAHDKITAFEKCIASLMSTTAFGLGSKYFALYEVAGVGIQWHTFSQSPVEGDDFNLLLAVTMLMVDAMVYGILTWYIEAVHPGMYGLPRPWYFPLQKSYWLGSGRTEAWEWSWPWARTPRLSVMEEDQACAMESRRFEETRGMEEEPTHLPLVVCVDKLTKVYKDDKKLALNKLSLNLYENQVVSFLGHNGAGKTTTMSILTGLFPPTSGSATIYGHDIRTEMDEIRKNLGMCPQHNVLFDRLTVEEHLWFYSRLKSMAQEEIRKEMDKMIEDLELSNKRHSLVQTLSGGMKRKLSVAIAFVGGSRAIILDEPTAGVDPYARRAIWDLILKYKPGRTILLSTHHMDEADLLGDRIAIISHGKLKCCGSPLFLKGTYGDGYRLTLVKRPAEPGAPPEPGLTSSPPSRTQLSSCSEPQVSQFIRTHVASCLLVSDTSTELSYILPSEAAKKGAFERLFQPHPAPPRQHLERSLDALHLSSFGLMDTTLEEVFLKVSEEDQSLENSEADVKESRKDVLPGAEGPTSGEGHAGNLAWCSELAQSQASLQSVSSVGSARGDEGAGYADVYGDYCPLFDNPQDPDNESLQEAEVEALSRVGQGSRKLDGGWLKLRQFHGLLVKRFHCARRNSKALFSQILLPAFFVCVAMTVALSVPEIGDLPPLVLSPSQYHNYTQPRGNFIPYANEERREYRLQSPDASPQQLVSTFRLPSGVGATCVLKSPANGSLGPTLNLSSGESRLLAARFFDSMCLESFTQGLPLSNFVPPPPSPAPSDSPASLDVDLQAWNTSLPPTTGPEMWTSAPSLPRLVREPVRCTCSSQGTGFSCPSSVGGHPPQMRVVTGDILTDITGHNVSEYLLFTSDRFRLHRYGAITFGNVLKSIPASFGTRAPPMVRKVAVRRAAQVFYNNKGYHSMPTYLNSLNNAILRANLPKSKGNPAAYGITVTNHPMNKTSASLSLDYLLQGTDVVIAIFIIVAMSFVPASFVVFLVAEKSTKAKHLQFVSGCNPVIYWLANYVWDMVRSAWPWGSPTLLIPPSLPQCAWRGHGGPQPFSSPHPCPSVLGMAMGVPDLSHPPSLLTLGPSLAALALQLNYLVPATCCVIILFVFDLPAYTSSTNFPAVLSLFLLYGWSITPIMYPASFWFEVPSSAYVFLIVINLFIGITATVATFLLQLFEHDKVGRRHGGAAGDMRGGSDGGWQATWGGNMGVVATWGVAAIWGGRGCALTLATPQDLKVVNSYLKSCFLIFPNYNLGHGLMEMAYNEYINEYYAKIGQFDKMKSPFEWDIVTRGLVAMAVEGVVGFFLTIMCQYNFLRRPQRMPVSTKPVEDDVDVASERQRVLRGDADNDMVKIENLTKVYKSRKIGRILAVDRLCLGVRPGECFGLLGVNGAGKTSTFKMLTGDESTTGGEAFVNGHSVLKELLQVQQSLGYCPQCDALFDELTAREHLQLYTRLRGIPWKDEARVVKWALEKLELTKYADKPAGTYSGGNKRKLSTAIALIGYPAFIFLDEPTTGMDPKARRFLWNLILDLIKTGRSVHPLRCQLCVSYSMEECEALCTRLAIMVNGRLRCLGSIQHLKNRFGDGYMITVRTKSSQSVKDVVRFFNRNFPEAMLKERHHTKVQYQLKSEHISLAQVFSKMEQVSGVLGIEDYSVSQTTLDNAAPSPHACPTHQVFVNFAKKQSDNLEQQETEAPSALQSPLSCLLSLLRPRPAPTELRALVADEPEDLDTEDEGLISFEEERVSRLPRALQGLGTPASPAHWTQAAWWLQFRDGVGGELAPGCLLSTGQEGRVGEEGLQTGLESLTAEPRLAGAFEGNRARMEQRGPEPGNGTV